VHVTKSAKTLHSYVLHFFDIFLQAQVDRLKTELSNKEQLLSATSEKERRLTTECDKLRRDVKTGKDEVHSKSSRMNL
jgi:hypothetical protein